MIVLVHNENSLNWVFDPKHPTQGRRFINGKDAILKHAERWNVPVAITHLDRDIDLQSFRSNYLELVHTPKYISQVVDLHRSGEWEGQRPDLSQLAVEFVQASVTAFEALERGHALTAVNLTGAKHHAQRGNSSGFCIFNDFAILSARLQAEGKRVAIFDLDAHHGDGTEALTRLMPNVLTFSVHEYGIFPHTGLTSDKVHNIYNHLLFEDDDDDELLEATDAFIELALNFKPDYVFITGGADGHGLDPLSHLNFSEYGYWTAGREIRIAFPTTPILMGGAGGYRPDDATPESWAHLAVALDK